VSPLGLGNKQMGRPFTPRIIAASFSCEGDADATSKKGFLAVIAHNKVVFCDFSAA